MVKKKADHNQEKQLQLGEKPCPEAQAVIVMKNTKHSILQDTAVILPKQLYELAIRKQT